MSSSSPSSPTLAVQTHQCAVSGGLLYVNAYGQGPLVLILGGISGDRQAITAEQDGWWQGLAEGVNPLRYTLITVDYAGGNGESEVSALPQSIAEQAAYISTALQQLDYVNLHAVVGGSYGGLVALELAQDKSLQIARLAVIGAA